MSSKRPIQLRHRRRKKINTAKRRETVRRLGTCRWQGRSNQPNGQRARHKQSQPHATELARKPQTPAKLTGTFLVFPGPGKTTTVTHNRVATAHVSPETQKRTRAGGCPRA